MKIRAILSYNYTNELNFTHLIHPKLRGSIWKNEKDLTHFTIEFVNNGYGFILPDTESEVILEMLDYSTTDFLKTDNRFIWGVAFKAIGEVNIIEFFL